MKRIIALLLATVLVFTLVGCGKKTRQVIKLTLSTEDAEAILNAAGIMLPDAEDAAGANTTVDYFSYYDPFHNYSEAEVVNTGYWTFTEKYGCEVNWIECEWGSRYDELANLVLSSNSPDFYPGENNAFPIRPIKGVFQPVDDYIDYTDPLWAEMSDFAYTYYSIKGRPYIIATDHAFGNVCVYNRRVMNEWGFDDPATLYYNDEWTWSKFYNMCADFSDPDEDRYALDDWYYSGGLMRSCGTSVVVYNTDEMKYEVNVDDPRLERAANLLYELSKNECIYPWWANGWSLRNGTMGSGMKEGNLLFAITGDWGFTGPVEEISNVWGDVTANEIMFCPMPRDDNGDGVYYTESNASGYLIVSGADNPEGVALLASCDRFKVLDPTVVNIDKRQKEETYLWTKEMLDMWQTCYDLAAKAENVIIVYDNGLGDKLGSVVSNYESNGHIQNAETWAQLKEANNEKLSFYVDEINTMIAEYNP